MYQLALLGKPLRIEAGTSRARDSVSTRRPYFQTSSALSPVDRSPDELYTAGVVALKLLKDTTYHLTHSVACCFVPNETWTEGDHVNRRYKLYGGAAVSDDYLTQHLSWYQSTGHLKGDNVSAIGPPQSGNAELTKFTIRRWAFFKLPGAVPVRWKSYSWSVSGYGDFKAPTPADLAIVESEGSMENLARKLLA